MNVEKIIKESKITMMIALIIGLALFITGTVCRVGNIQLISNTKAIVGLSFIPLGVAFAYYIKLRSLRKSTKETRTYIISETDERLVSLKNEADAKAFKIVQSALLLTYTGYILAVPEDIYKAVGWWILLGLVFLSFVSQGILRETIVRKGNEQNEEE